MKDIFNIISHQLNFIWSLISCILMVKNQIVNLTPNYSFGHNLISNFQMESVSSLWISKFKQLFNNLKMIQFRQNFLFTFFSQKLKTFTIIQGPIPKVVIYLKILGLTTFLSPTLVRICFNPKTFFWPTTLVMPCWQVQI